VWPGLYHEIFNEPEQAEVLQVMADWLDVQLPDRLAA
jgi:alpha-beta hydrolase superfamily lysophospholipase